MRSRLDCSLAAAGTLEVQLNSEQSIRVSKTIARVLRHQPELVGVQLDSEGWCQVSELLAKLTESGLAISRIELEQIVQTNDKKRFALSADGEYIRASQGHSVEGVDLQLQEMAPPPVLYHGTNRPAMRAIDAQGLLPMTRHHVHLSPGAATAAAIGGRRGPAVILVVDSFRLHIDGAKFFLSENNVWLTDAVSRGYLKMK